MLAHLRSAVAGAALVPVLAVVVMATTLTACFTGERPSFAPAEPEIGDPAISTVVDLLESPRSTQFTATYSIVTKLGSEVIPTTTAIVAQTGPSARSMTIGNIRYLDQNGSQQTCNLVTVSCVDGFDDAQISNLLVNHDFYATAPAARLRQDANTMVSAAIGSTTEIASLEATCVQVNFAAGNKQYCALDNGVLAYQDTPDLQIQLLAFDAGADPALFTSSTVAGG